MTTKEKRDIKRKLIPRNSKQFILDKNYWPDPGQIQKKNPVSFDYQGFVFQYRGATC